jgi:hypothetical protein
MVVSTQFFGRFQIEGENSVCCSIVRGSGGYRVVYEDVHWINVTHDQIWKWVLQTW